MFVRDFDATLSADHDIMVGAFAWTDRIAETGLFQPFDEIASFD